jgi:TrmH family RNA methyltransferase
VAVRAAAPDRAVTVPLVLVLAGVGDPGNAGTLLRSAEAAGATAVWATAGTVDLYAPKTVRASAGALFHVPVRDGLDGPAALDGLRAAGVRVLGTAASGGTPVDQADLTGPVAFVLGNEAHGLDGVWAGAVDEWLTIPMVGRAESLNVAMAGTLLCFEAARQRRGDE